MTLIDGIKDVFHTTELQNTRYIIITHRVRARVRARVRVRVRVSFRIITRIWASYPRYNTKANPNPNPNPCSNPSLGYLNSQWADCERSILPAPATSRSRSARAPARAPAPLPLRSTVFFQVPLPLRSAPAHPVFGPAPLHFPLQLGSAHMLWPLGQSR